MPTDLDPRVARSRAKVLDAATDLLVEAGARAVTVDAVARRSGVAKSTLYRHWESREDLLVDVMRANVPEIDPPAEGLGFEPSLRHLLRSLAATLAAPEWARIMPALISLQQQMPELKQLSDLDRHAKVTVLQEILVLGAEEGVVPAGLDAQRAAHFLIGPLVFANLSGHDDELDEIADEAVDRFIAAHR